MTAQTDLQALPRTRNILVRGIDDGLHLGAQLYVWHGGDVAADMAVGEARPGEPLRNDDLMLWMSSCKPVTAVAIMRQIERGRLRLDDPVARHIPEFAQNGKESITVRHLLTHTAGLRAAAMNANGRAWDEIIADISAARIEPRWIVGETAGYHSSSSWYLLAEIVQRVADLSFPTYVRDKIFRPLGMHDSWIGMPPERYREYARRIVPIYDTSKGSFDQEQFSNTEAGVVLPRPAGNGSGPLRELGRFYQMLMAGGTLDDVRILSSTSVNDMVARHRAGKHDKTFNHVIDFGLGFILNSSANGEESVPYGYGPYASRQTFGHSGNQSSCAFCDPQQRLVVAWACNGMPGETAHQKRQRAINAAIYEDLRLASG